MINKDTQKIKRIELPICTTPEVRTYSYYALPQCIIMAEERIGKRSLRSVKRIMIHGHLSG